MSDVSARLEEALSALQEVVDAIGPEQAHAELDDTMLQLFWREWPDLSSWAGALWRHLNEDLAEPASQVQDSELDEVGDGGAG